MTSKCASPSLKHGEAQTQNNEGRDPRGWVATGLAPISGPHNDNVDPNAQEPSPHTTALTPSLSSLTRDPRYRLVTSWVALGTTPLFLFVFVVLSLVDSPWWWLLVAGVLATVPFNIRDAIRHAGAFRVAPER